MRQTGNYYYGARYYDPKSSLWLSVDPLAEKYPNFSPYAYTFQNPLNFVDPTGMEGESTHIDDKGKVVAVYDDGDNGVYQHGKNADGGTVTAYQINKRHEKYGTSANGKKVGETLTPFSFVGDEGQVITGAEINLNDQSGQNFFNNEIKNVGLFEYMNNAKGGEPLDFKTRDMPQNLTNEAQDQYVYRGMPFEGKIASARDIGNYAAGYVSGIHGFGWGASRFAFDALQTRQERGTWNTILWYPFNRVREGQPTQQAQRAGHNVGFKIFKQQQFEREWRRATNPWPIGPKI